MTAEIGWRGVGVRLSLLVGIAFAFTTGMTRPWGVVLAVVLLVILAVDLRWEAGELAVIGLALAGLVLRLEAYQVGTSDVLTVTAAAIERMLDGGNPYGVGYAETNPPGAPFPYGPFSLLWYLPFRDDPRRFEFFVSLVLLAVFTVRAHPLGLALYATFPPLLTVASDGANDTSEGLLLLAAFVALGRVGPAGGALLAVAVAFKPFALAWLPALFVGGGLANVVGFLAVSALAWGPPLLFWGPGSIAASFVLAEAVHQSPYYSLPSALEVSTRQRVSAELFERLRLILGGITALLTAPFARTTTGVVVSGLLVYLVTLYTGYWSTFAYLAAIAPIVCWSIDRWLGLDAARVRWPDDPVGRLSATVDRRWRRRPEPGGS